MNRKHRYKFRPPFNPAIELGVLINTDAVHRYRKLHGLAAFGKAMMQIRIDCVCQDFTALKSNGLVGQVITRRVISMA